MQYRARIAREMTSVAMSRPEASSATGVQQSTSEYEQHDIMARICQHKLYPLLKMLLLKLETVMADLPVASTLTDDALLDEALRNVAPGTISEDDEDHQLGVFMRDAVRELRWQLVELQKVNDHCEDFCRRFNCAYCNNMLHTEILSTCGESDDDDNGASFDTPNNSTLTTAYMENGRSVQFSTESVSTNTNSKPTASMATSSQPLPMFMQRSPPVGAGLPSGIDYSALLLRAMRHATQPAPPPPKEEAASPNNKTREKKKRKLEQNSDPADG